MDKRVNATKRGLLYDHIVDIAGRAAAQLQIAQDFCQLQDHEGFEHSINRFIGYAREVAETHREIRLLNKEEGK